VATKLQLTNISYIYVCIYIYIGEGVCLSRRGHIVKGRSGARVLVAAGLTTPVSNPWVRR
jgi:hypothetical protein